MDLEIFMWLVVLNMCFSCLLGMEGVVELSGAWTWALVVTIYSNIYRNVPVMYGDGIKTNHYCQWGASISILYTHTYIYIYTETYTYIYIYTYIHTYVYTYMYIYIFDR